VQQYWECVVVLILLIVTLKLDVLKSVALSHKDGFKADFYRQRFREKIEKNVKENNEPVNPRVYADFKKVEEKVLRELQHQYKEKFKTKVHFLFGEIDKPEFMYTPDASVQTKNELILFEIKYILKPELADQIIGTSIKYLTNVTQKLEPSTGKELVLRLVLVSSFDVELSSYRPPEGIELEHFKI
jgi:hypothetical protein